MSTQSSINQSEGMPMGRPASENQRQRADDGRLPSDQLFHLLANRRRRAVLYYLREHDETVSMRDLAERIAAWEHGTTIRTLGSSERQRVYISLYQNHLPKLDDHGVIEYDQSRGTVERTERADQLDRYIQEFPYSGPTGRHAIDRQPDEPTHTRLDRSAVVRTVMVGTTGAGVLVTGWLELVSASVLLALTWMAICLVSAFDMAGGIDARLESYLTSNG